MYVGIKQETGPNVKKIAPLKSKQARLSLMGRSKWKVERWVSEEALSSIQLMPIMVELDAEPTATEFEKAIK